ncbi:ANL_HP_G0117780.mRNA.1.CDS.1 [Saccharomyces cerevisiae]|nr:ANL_HP_G0117780.mRNA.1.CDS.1 [Saccharomyces cerevisiae]CAI6986976.1 ANL_HP_G0117780.mRNA.1.CDS.1 [Saccharomyces cerevisiae]
MKFSLIEYSRIEKELIEADRSLKLQCNNLTSVAPSILLQTGLAGKQDPGSIIAGQSRVCCAITNVGISDEAFLCKFLSQITESSTNKAIFLLDGSNDEFVRNTITKRCHDVGCPLEITDPSLRDYNVHTDTWGTLEVRLPYSEEEYQIFNLRVAIAVLDFLSKEKKVCISKDQLSQGLISVDWPKKLYSWITVINTRERKILHYY